MKKPTKAEALAYMRELARHMKSYSDFGQHKRIPGPSAGRAWELGMELDIALDAIEEPMSPLPIIEPHLLEVGK